MMQILEICWRVTVSVLFLRPNTSIGVMNAFKGVCTIQITS